MWAADKKLKMVKQLEMEDKDSGQKQPLMKTKLKSLKNIERRIFALCLSTWFFGYVLTEISLFPNVVWYNSFGPDMIRTIYIGPCLGIVPLGASVGVIIGNFTQNRMSRRKFLIMVSLLAIGFSGALQAGGVVVLFVFRGLQGVVAGMLMNFIPMYINELTPKEVGSRFGIYPQIAVVLGVLVAYVVAMIITNCFGFQFLPTNVSVEEISIPGWQSEVFWRVMLIISVLPGLFQILMVLIGYIPESPVYLIEKNQNDKAKEVMSLFYKEEYLETALENKIREVHEQAEKTEDPVKWTCKGYFIGFQLAIFQAMTGIAAYVVLTGNIVAVVLNAPVFSIYVPIVITIAQLVGTLISVPLMRFVEWKSLTLVGGFALAFWNGLIGMFIYFFDHYSDFENYGLTLAVVTILAFLFTFGVTVGSSTWPYIQYMIPPNAVTCAQVLNWFLTGCTIIFLSVDINETGSPVIMIWVFGGSTLFLTILNWIMMINIKKRNVIEVQERLFHGVADKEEDEHI